MLLFFIKFKSRECRTKKVLLDNVKLKNDCILHMALKLKVQFLWWKQANFWHFRRTYRGHKGVFTEILSYNKNPYVTRGCFESIPIRSISPLTGSPAMVGCSKASFFWCHLHGRNDVTMLTTSLRIFGHKYFSRFRFNVLSTWKCDGPMGIELVVSVWLLPEWLSNVRHGKATGRVKKFLFECVLLFLYITAKSHFCTGTKTIWLISPLVRGCNTAMWARYDRLRSWNKPLQLGCRKKILRILVGTVKIKKLNTIIKYFSIWQQLIFFINSCAWKILPSLFHTT